MRFSIPLYIDDQCGGLLLTVSQRTRAASLSDSAGARPARIILPKVTCRGIEVRPVELTRQAVIAIADVAVDQVVAARVAAGWCRRTAVIEALNHGTHARPLVLGR